MSGDTGALWLALRLQRDLKLEHAPGSHGPPACLALPDGCAGIMYVFDSPETALAAGFDKVAEVSKPTPKGDTP